MTRPGGYTLAPGQEWTGTAARWPVILMSRETEPGHWQTHVVPAQPAGPRTQWHLCCLRCPDRPSVFCLSPDASQPGYHVACADVMAGILGHIRRSHPDVVPS